MLVMMDYTNWRGERRERPVKLLRAEFGANEWHPEPQWLIYAEDLEDGIVKTFATKGIHSWSPL